MTSLFQRGMGAKIEERFVKVSGNMEGKEGVKKTGKTEDNIYSMISLVMKYSQTQTYWRVGQSKWEHQGISKKHIDFRIEELYFVGVTSHLKGQFAQ